MLLKNWPMPRYRPKINTFHVFSFNLDLRCAKPVSVKMRALFYSLILTIFATSISVQSYVYRKHHQDVLLPPPRSAGRYQRREQPPCQRHEVHDMDVSPLRDGNIHQSDSEAVRAQPTERVPWHTHHQARVRIPQGTARGIPKHSEKDRGRINRHALREYGRKIISLRF